LTATTNQEAVVPERPQRREHIPLGILHMVGATLVFSVSSAATKWLVATYPVGEVLFIRSLVSLMACAAFILPATGLAVFRTRRLHHHAMRSFSQFCSQSFLVTAFSLMPLAGAIAINFSAPLFTALVSIVLLKEKVGLARWSALLIGFLGVVIVTHPGTETFQIGALFALGNAILYGSVTAAVRGMTATESIETLTLYQLVWITGFFALVAPIGFIMPGWADAGLIVFAGLSNAIGQYWWTKSLHLGPASAIAPFFYLSLVWAIVIGYLVWGDVPTVGLIMGSAIVVGSGLFLFWREARKM
jgi:drug/metabolite transporter (DMT)-like permease